MTQLRRIVLIRHGNTVGNSHERFHGSSDVALSDEGREQVRAAGRQLQTEVFDVIAASPQRRAWQSAALLSGGHPILLVPELREIDFGRWEGLTAQEIGEARVLARHQEAEDVRLAARDPPLDYAAVETEAGARIEEARSLLLGLDALRLEILRRAEAGVSVAALDQLMSARHVALDRLALQERTFVPGHAEPA